MGWAPGGSRELLPRCRLGTRLLGPPGPLHDGSHSAGCVLPLPPSDPSALVPLAPPTHFQSAVATWGPCGSITSQAAAQSPGDSQLGERSPAWGRGHRVGGAAGCGLIRAPLGRPQQMARPGASGGSRTPWGPHGGSSPAVPEPWGRGSGPGPGFPCQEGRGSAPRAAPRPCAPRSPPAGPRWCRLKRTVCEPRTRGVGLGTLSQV